MSWLGYDLDSTHLFLIQSVTVRGGRFLEAPLVGTLLQEQDNERQLPLILTAGDFSLYEDCIPCFDSFTKTHFYLGNTLLFVIFSIFSALSPRIKVSALVLGDCRFDSPEFQLHSLLLRL